MGPAGDFDYEALDSDYSAVRSTDPRIAQYVHAALGTAITVRDVGAGAGSYEPPDCLRYSGRAIGIHEVTTGARATGSHRGGCGGSSIS